jgi:nucleoside-diphosphate-sugar epimerase
MKVAVIGATGATGKHLTRTLLERGHEVTALVRDPTRLGELADRVRMVHGTSTDPDAIKDLLAGNEAVVSALGPTKKEPTLHQDTARVLVEAMRREGIRRFIGISGAGIDVPGDRKAAKDKGDLLPRPAAGRSDREGQTRRVPDLERERPGVDARPPAAAPQRPGHRSPRASRAPIDPVEHSLPR